MFPQIFLNTIPVAIAFDVQNKRIGFFRPDDVPVFIDNREELQCIWGACGIILNMVEYSYNEFYKVEGDIETYFRSLIQSDYIDRGLNSFFYG